MSHETQSQGRFWNRRAVSTASVLIGFSLAALEGTVITTALPSAVGSLGGLSIYAWAMTTFLLAAAVSIPVWGKLADIYGRKRLFLAGIGVFVIGSIACGFAQSMNQLIVLRFIQGIGGGAMFALPYTILGIIYPPDKRGEAIGWANMTWGLASFSGPVIGFAIVSVLDWRWAFFLPAIIGMVGFVLAWLSLDESTGEADPNVDYFGAIALTIGIAAILIAVEEAGSLTIGSTVFGLLVVGLLAFVAFYIIEHRAAEPLIPLSFFQNTTYVGAVIACFCASFVAYVAITFVPLLLQSLSGNAAGAALGVFPAVVAWSIMGYVGGWAVPRVGARRLVLSGAALLIVGTGWTATWGVTTPLYVRFASVFLIGAGAGTIITPALTTLQNTYGTEQMGTVTSSFMFAQNLGAAVGPAVMGVAMNVVLRRKLATVPQFATIEDIQRVLSFGAESLPETVGQAMVAGVTFAFTLSLVLCAVSLLAGYFVSSSTGPERDGSIESTDNVGTSR